MHDFLKVDASQERKDFISVVPTYVVDVNKDLMKRVEKKRYLLKETCEAINHCQKRDRMYARFEREFRNTFMCWNPVTAMWYMTNQERIMYAQNCFTSLLSNYEKYKERVIEAVAD